MVRRAEHGQPGEVWAGTGHRPPRLGNPQYTREEQERLVGFARGALLYLDPGEVISGGAAGWDQALAEAALHFGIPYTMAIPHDAQEKTWPEEAQDHYRWLVSMAKEVVVVSPGPYAAWKCHVRDRWMVDRAQRVLALWDGAPKGGTYGTLKYAEAAGKPVLNLWTEWMGIR